MKLKNKKTGKIKEVMVGGYPVTGKTKMWECLELDSNEETGYKSLGTYTSLAELNAEWEDYEEPKEFYFIDQFMSVSKGVVDDVKYAGRHNAVNYAKKTSNNLKTAGNYFETREEAEKAVEKLKAWKRLKDKGFRITLRGCKGNAWLQANWGNLQGDYSDVLLLFGGEE